MLKKIFLSIILTGLSVFLFSAFANEHNNKLTSQEISQVNNIFKLIKDNYAEEVTNDQLMVGALSGMLVNLGSYSNYLDKKTYRDFQFGMNDRYHGIGAVMTLEKGIVKVAGVFVKSPAEKAGLLPGNYILAVNGKTVIDIPLMEVIKKIKGIPGTKVTLTVVDNKKKKKITISRRSIKFANINAALLEDNYGYISIAHFSNASAKETVQAVHDLREQAQGNLKGLILDLRGNPGGSLKDAVDISDIFLNSTKLKNKLIVQIKSRHKNIEKKHFADPYDILQNAPLIVLIDRFSASGAEIVAGTLKHHNRALIMGTKSFGKGSVQTIYPYKNRLGGAIKLTIARYYLPSGKTISKKNRIEPDIIVDPFDSNSQASELLLLHRAGGKGDDLETALKQDSSINDALKLLKGMQVFNVDG